jgi:hypothetical protein
MTTYSWYYTGMMHVGAVPDRGWKKGDITRGVEAFRDKEGNLALQTDAEDMDAAFARFQKWAKAADDGGDFYK